MSEVTEGTCTGTIDNWDVVEVDMPTGVVLKLVIWFKCAGDGWTKNIKWDGFFMTREGLPNKNTYKTLKTCGFTSSDVGDLISDESALDKTEVYNLTVEQNDDGYWAVKWVNTPGETQGAITDKQVLKGHNLAKLNAALGTPKPKLKNHAPLPPAAEGDDEIDSFLN